ncbi:unnamed protein product [Rhizophagus irregularis]|nr:unnamed protein product [Rhizophagus irregularis]
MEIWRGIINLLNGRKGLWALALSGLWSLGISKKIRQLFSSLDAGFEAFIQGINPPLKYKNITPPNKKLEKVVSLPTPISYDNMKPMMPNCLCKKGKEGQLE